MKTIFKTLAILSLPFSILSCHKTNYESEAGVNRQQSEFYFDKFGEQRLGVSNLVGLAAADFDKDGKIDLAILTGGVQSSRIILYKNNISTTSTKDSYK